MADNGEPTIDLDALQAQVNMAMAETEELVSSWVRPSKRARPKQSLEEVEKELQEYMRRPPRLGVGAPIPETIGPSAREEAKLKDKLVGHDKKRRREGEPSGKEEMEDEDEEDVRKGETGQKRVRLDPFSGSKKKAKQREVEEKSKSEVGVQINGKHVPPFTPAVLDIREAQMSSTSSPLNPATLVLEKPEMHKPPISQSIMDDLSPLVSTKKKKLRDNGETTSVDGVLGASGKNTNVDVLIAATDATNDVNIDEEEWTGFGDLEIESADSQTQLDVSKNTLNGKPLLNLNGPPASDDGDVTQSPTSTKKKRKRRKKNRPVATENGA